MPGPMRLIQIILRPIFYLLYHQFAWAYDLVAAIVSLGRWQEWVHTALPYISGRVLEIGFGPGHLQISLNEKIIPTFGLDESPQMGRQAARRIKKAGAIARLTRGYAQSIPFAGEAFDSVVATFPAEYHLRSTNTKRNPTCASPRRAIGHHPNCLDHRGASAGTLGSVGFPIERRSARQATPLVGCAKNSIRSHRVRGPQ